MTNAEAVNWLINITADIGKAEHSDLWHYEQALSEIREMLEDAQPQLDTCPIYGGMCGYPSNLCYECPRHEGAKERPQWWTEGLQPFAQPQWIPVTERLPEDSDYHDLWETPDGAVLWCKETGEIGIGWYYASTKNWCDLWDNSVRDVVAWMPLPEPYKGEQE